MRTWLLAIAALLALATGCADESVPTSDPGHTVAPSAEPTDEPTDEPTEEPTTEPSATPTTAAPTTDLGKAFRAFARGGVPPPMADEVQLYLGNAFTGVVTESDANEPVAWATCTEVGAYAGRTCPLSPLTSLQRHAAVEYLDRPRGRCLPTYAPVPPDLRELDRTVVVPALTSAEQCAQNFAIQLFADDEGRLVAVSTLLGEP